MRERVQRQAAIQARCVIAKMVCRPGMRKLMEGKRDQKRDDTGNQNWG